MSIGKPIPHRGVTGEGGKLYYMYDIRADEQEEAEAGRILLRNVQLVSLWSISHGPNRNTIVSDCCFHTVRP